MTEITEDEEFKARCYQEEILDIATKKNTIVYLPTGSGKTYIAILLIKRMSNDIIESFDHGGKLTFFLVNSVPLVEQHYNVIKRHLPFEVGKFSGDMNVDFWGKDKWITEFNKTNIFVMTAQILLDILSHGYLVLDKINLIIFDECHQAVNDHPMRQIMQRFMNTEESKQPRVLGLTATLLNGNCLPKEVEKEVRTLETTFHSQVATIKQMAQVLGFSTKPEEIIISFCTKNTFAVLPRCHNIINDLLNIFVNLNLPSNPSNSNAYNSLEPKKNITKQVIKNLKSLKVHFDMCGVYGAYYSTLLYIVYFESMQFQTEDNLFLNMLNVVTTQLTAVLKILDDSLKAFSEKDKIHEFSSPQVLRLIEILRTFKESGNTMNAIIFVQQRFTAKVLFYILNNLAKHDSYFSFISASFIVGSNANSRDRNCKELLFESKVNKKVVQKFKDGDLNLLVASNVIEEGLDIPACTLVVKFDYPNNYRAYVQSKGRARQKGSYYYIMVPTSEKSKFYNKYLIYQNVEKILIELLVGKNEIRMRPSQEEIEEDLYKDLDSEPYYVQGPKSSHVFAVSAISLLNKYCQALGNRDRYAQLAPEWYLKKENDKNVVLIEMPVLCPLRKIVKGPPKSTKLAAKRAAALEVCKLLHKLGELNDHLLPYDGCEISDEDSKYLFKHWMQTDLKNDKSNELHKIKIPDFLLGKPILPNENLYLHWIKFEPLFDEHLMQFVVFSELMKSELGYALLSANPLPSLCDFPLYVSAGELNVHISVNIKTVQLSSEQLTLLKQFQNFIFADLLNVLKDFLLFNDNENGGAFMVVPIRKTELELSIAFDIAQENKELVTVEEPTSAKKEELVVDDEHYLNKVICPWYRASIAKYVVIQVCYDKSALTNFPNDEFNNFVEYYKEKYNVKIVNPHVPLLLAKALSSKLNCLKPRSATLQKKRDYQKLQDGLEEHLVPEMCVVQTLPSELWFKSSCLPSILHRVMFLLRAEEIRQIIATDTKLGTVNLPEGLTWQPLPVDPLIFNLNAEKKKTPAPRIPEIGTLTLPPPGVTKPKALNKNYAMKILEKQYPWKDEQEPRDIEKNIDDVTLFEIKFYNQFFNVDVLESEDERSNNNSENLKFKALTFEKEYNDKSIQLLSIHDNQLGPQQWQVFQALMSAQADDVLNFERLETLGDSFLKFSTSLFLLFKYPNFNEGRLTSWKCKMVGNKNLFYCALAKGLGGYIKSNNFEPLSNWFPPGYRIPEMVFEKIEQNLLPANKLFNLPITPQEQISGVLTEETKQIFEYSINIMMSEKDEDQAETFSTMQRFLGYQSLRNKMVSDCVEALLGVYLLSNGIEGGFKLLSWLNIIPESEHPTEILKQVSPSPFFDKSRICQDVKHLLPNYRQLEKELGYTFNNHGYLLQALTHASYTSNRLTDCYQRLEFLGDAVLDFLITCYLYEISSSLTPGQLTDLRSALVNNITFAGYVVRYQFYKHLKCMSTNLMDVIDTFVKFQEEHDFAINEDTLILIEENPWYMAEHVNVPKVLGDLFEALAGAVFLDSGMNLKVVWQVFYRLMWKEFETFRVSIPRNPVRMLYEYSQASPDFKDVEMMNGVTKVSVCITCDGKREIIHGFGENKKEAKCAAAKLALRLLQS